MSSYKSVSSLALILKRLPASSSVIFNEVDCVLSLGFSRLLSSLSVAVLFVLCLLQVVLVFIRSTKTSRQSPNRENDFSLCVLLSYSHSCPVERVVGGVPMFLSFLTIGRHRVAPSVRRIVELLSGRVHSQMDGFISLQGGRNLS